MRYKNSIIFTFKKKTNLNNYNWLSFRVVVVVVIFSVSPFSWPFDIDVMMDFTTTVFELVSIVSLWTRKVMGKMSKKM